MRTLITMLATSVLIVGLSSSAQATTLNAGPLLVKEGGRVRCGLLNVGNRDLKDVTIRNPMSNDDIDEASAATLAPGDILVVGNINEATGFQESWCEFEFKGGKNKVRATLCIFTAEGCAGTVYGY